MSPIRKAIIFVISTAMIAGGGWLLYKQFTVSRIIWGRLVLTGVMLVTIGVAWLWHDVIAPMVARKT